MHKFRFLCNWRICITLFLLGFCASALFGGTIDFNGSDWTAIRGVKLYRGGPNNTLTDPVNSVDFIIAYGEMFIENDFLHGGNWLFLSPIISANGTTDPRGRVVIRFSDTKSRVKLEASHDPTEVNTPAYMQVVFYKDHNPVNPLHSVEVPWNSGAFTDVEYSNNTDGIRMVIINTMYAENTIDNIEFDDMGSGSDIPDKFDFDDGTVQGWSLEGAFDNTGGGPFSHNFVFGWKDPVNYPNPPGGDASGNNNGSIQMFTMSGHGINNPGQSWWIMRFKSPDLSSAVNWQNASGYSVEIAECMASFGSLYANLYVVIYDPAQGQDRYFYSGEAQVLQHDVYGDGSADWNHFTFNWPVESGFPETYTVKEIFVNIWGQMSTFLEGGLYLDEVTMIPGDEPHYPPTPPNNLHVGLLPDQLHVTWDDNSDNELGFILEGYNTPAISTSWRVIATLPPNTTSYQYDNPLPSHTYYFRVKAFNEHGNSDPSNTDNLMYAYLVSWINIDSPVGGEVWEPGTTHEIIWRNGSLNRPTTVTIDLSLDGGSHWETPSIASNTANDGSYMWTVPNTLSENCIIRIKDPSDGFPYDLSNHPFTIGTPTDPVLSVTPISLDFGTTQTSLSFQIENSGVGTLMWNVAENPDKNWITSVTPASGSGNATVSVTVNRSQMSGTTDAGTISVTSNGGDQDVAVSIEKAVVSLPAHWNFIANTGRSATIVLPTTANPNIDGVPLQAGDYVGLFSEAGLCCGNREWTGSNLSLTAWGDDDQTSGVIDGFQAGETILYRVYRPSEAKEYTFVDVGYSQGNGLFSNNSFMVLNQFDATDIKSIIVDFAQGWNMFSVNVAPEDPNIATLMGSISTHLVLVKNNSGNTYIPEFGINDIGNLDFKQGYQAYLKQAQSLNFEGAPVDPTTPITMQAGWNMISYLPDNPINAATALASISSALVLAKNNSGNTYIPEFGINDIGSMQPTQGYQIYLTSGATLTYPASSSLHGSRVENEKIIAKSKTEHFQHASLTGESAVIVVPANINPRYSDNSALNVGDEIGVFTTDGMCCGARVWDGTNTAITVWGNNSLTDTVEGFLATDTFRFRIWNMAEEQEYIADAEFEPGHPVVYQSGGFSVLTELTAMAKTSVASKEIMNIPKSFVLKQNYPNPFNPETVIEYDLPVNAQVVLKIYDVRGNEVRTLESTPKSAGSHTVMWNGRNKFGTLVSSGVYFYELNVVSKNATFSQTRKMILMK